MPDVHKGRERKGECCNNEQTVAWLLAAGEVWNNVMNSTHNKQTCHLVLSIRWCSPCFCFHCSMFARWKDNNRLYILQVGMCSQVGAYVTACHTVQLECGLKKILV